MLNTNKLAAFLLEYDFKIPDEKALAFLDDLLCTSEKSIYEVFETLYAMDEKKIQDYMDYISLVKVQEGDKIQAIQRAIFASPRIFVNNFFL